jgi:hypothetical protein
LKFIYTPLYYLIVKMLPLDLWQFCIIDYLEYIDQCKLVTHIPSLQLTNLIGLPDFTD